MKHRSRIWIGAGLLLVLLLLARCAWNHFSGNSAAEKTAGPIAAVTTAKVQRKTISENVSAYGSVVAQPGKTHSVSVAFEARVQHILVAPGEFVKQGDPLIEIAPSAAAQLQVQQAQNAVQSAQKELKQVQDRFNLKLATNQELTAAQKAASDAMTQLTALQQAGAGGDNRIRSDTGGVVAKVDVQDGQTVPAGNPFVEIVAEDAIEVKLGIEAEDLPALKAGDTIAVFPVNNPDQPTVQGIVRLVTRRVDPATRLIDVYVTLPQGTKLFLDGFVRGEFARSNSNALVVPRPAVLPDDQGGFRIFTVSNGRAKLHEVKIGLQNAQEIEVISNDVRAGDEVVTSGNYELADEMAVAVEQAK
jgi:RND family efflux transporter MFP subunit